MTSRTNPHTRGRGKCDTEASARMSEDYCTAGQPAASSRIIKDHHHGAPFRPRAVAGGSGVLPSRGYPPGRSNKLGNQ
eukprot:844978-Prorocentrum_minimum.AAC.3